MRIVFVAAVILYILLMVWGLTDAHYIDTYSSNAMLEKLFVNLVIISIITGLAFFFWFDYLFPEWRENQTILARVIIAVGFVVLSGTFNRWIFLLYNNYAGAQNAVVISGTVTSKYKAKKKNTASFYLVVWDSREDMERRLKLSRKAFNAFDDSEKQFNKEFKIGALGVIYRRDL